MLRRTRIQAKIGCDARAESLPSGRRYFRAADQWQPFAGTHARSTMQTVTLPGGDDDPTALGAAFPQRPLEMF
jgi:hypothetical protein